ncbi:MAG: type II toxin-antitoxin system RelE family toxin [Candidatus Ranarchaeia archaeon]
MTYEVLITKSALKPLKRFSTNITKQIHKQIQRLENFPDVPNIKKLSGLHNKYRLRVEKYRVLFELSE